MIHLYILSIISAKKGGGLEGLFVFKKALFLHSGSGGDTINYGASTVSGHNESQSHLGGAAADNSGIQLNNWYIECLE